MDFAKDFSNEARKAIDHLKEELQGIRTGRPASNILDAMSVDAYGGSTKMKMMEMATISAEGSNTLAVTPFDPSTLQDIEKAIQKSPLGLTPKVQGNRILVVFPQLNEEQREKFVKLVGQHVEEHRQRIRNERDEVRKKVKAAFDAKTITEDDKFRIEKDIDSANTKLMEEIQQMKDKKEAQIREV